MAFKCPFLFVLCVALGIVRLFPVVGVFLWRSVLTDLREQDELDLLERTKLEELTELDLSEILELEELDELDLLELPELEELRTSDPGLVEYRSGRPEATPAWSGS